MTLSPLRVLFLFIIRGQHRYFSPQVLTQIDRVLRPNDWKGKHKCNSSDFFFFCLIDLFSRTSIVWGSEKHYCQSTVINPNCIVKKATIKSSLSSVGSEVSKHVYHSDANCLSNTAEEASAPSDPATSFSSHDLWWLQHQLWVIRHQTRACCHSHPLAFLGDQMCPLSQTQVVRDLCPRLFCQSRNCSGAEGQTGKC